MTLIEQNIRVTLIPENILRLFKIQNLVVLDLADVNLHSSMTMIWQQNKLKDTYLKVITGIFHNLESKVDLLEKANDLLFGKYTVEIFLLRIIINILSVRMNYIIYKS